jgi:putative flippase GtrA
MSTRLRRHVDKSALARRFVGYSAGSVVATVTSELAFLATLGWLHAGTTWASAAGFVGGAVPNYILNRRWAWSGGRARDRRTEIALYMAVALSSFAASAVATHWAEVGARGVTTSHGWNVVMTGAAYLGVSAVFFLVKFVLYERVVFTPAANRAPAASEPTT